jgi:hypothetical protein
MTGKCDELSWTESQLYSQQIEGKLVLSLFVRLVLVWGGHFIVIYWTSPRSHHRKATLKPKLYYDL